MSLGLPSNLALGAIARAFLRAMNVVGLTLLAAAFLIIAAFQAAHPMIPLWPALVGMVASAAALWWNGRVLTATSAVIYIVVGTAGIFAFVYSFGSPTVPLTASDAFSLALPKIAMMMVATAGGGFLHDLAWSASAVLIGSGGGIAALLATGRPWAFDWTTFWCFVTVAGLQVISYVAVSRFRRVQPLLHRAVREEQLALARSRVEANASAIIHDTLLSHLAAIAIAAPGKLDDSFARAIAEDMEVLVGRDWLARPAELEARDGELAPQELQLLETLDSARLLGLDVALSGDTGPLGALSAARAEAVSLAVRQCLVNVVKHAGTGLAEVVVHGSADDVSVMVIDGGVGFSEAETGEDRMGLRHSVRRRVEDAGGSVRVWSAPGHGTSILIRMPTGATS